MSKNLSVSDVVNRVLAVNQIENVFEWRKWIEKIPYIQFPEHWLVEIIPPFGGAIVRFWVRHKDNEKVEVSVYLDCYDMLGCVGEPYWEVYPYDGDVYRCKMDNITELLEAIEYCLQQQME